MNNKVSTPIGMIVIVIFALITLLVMFSKIKQYMIY